MGRDETIHLATLGALVERGLTPADRLVAGLDDAPTGESAARAIFERCQIGAAQR
jgi:hypothetical protein